MSAFERLSWRWPVLWVLAIAITVTAGMTTIREAAEWRVEQEANAIALSHAKVIVSAVRKLPSFMRSGRIEWSTTYDLKRFAAIGDVFRFSIFDASGNLILMSEDLLKNEIDWTWVNLRKHYGGSQALRDGQILAGESMAELFVGDRSAGQPEYFSKAYVPLVINAQALGVIEVHIDQTARHTAITQDYIEIGLIGAALLAGLSLLGVFQWRDGWRRRNAIEERVKYLAHYDMLSGALNRASFNARLEEAATRQHNSDRNFSVHYLDLDRFKAVNDTLGHAAGDQIIQQTAERVQRVLSPADHLARLGGDEFAVLQEHIPGVRSAPQLAADLVQTLAEPFKIAGEEVACPVSIGTASFGSDATSPGVLMSCADLALRSAKNKGGNGFCVYDLELTESVRRERRFIEDLRQAVLEESMTLAYQPLFEANSTRLTGYEALLRWEHPERGNIPPGDFIPIAEKNGLISAIGSWVLKQACHDASLWPRKLTVAVNLSAAQFDQDQVVSDVTQALAESGLEPERLEVEITESLLMVNTDRVVEALHLLRTFGVSIAMDDFGTGYSSLAYLWQFPFDKVKIDRAFTQGLDVDPKVSLIVSSIVSMAHSLRIRVNAEGVETAEQMAELKKCGCDELQGFFLGRPTPDEKLSHRDPALDPQKDNASIESQMLESGELVLV